MGATAAEIHEASVRSLVTVTEDLKDIEGASSQQVNSTALNPTQSTYNLTSTPPGKYYSSDKLALVAAAATIDLTALPGLQANIDGTGLKVQMFRIRRVGTGGNALTVSPGAANPYALVGAGNAFVIAAGNTKPFQFEFEDTTPEVAAGAKEIDLAGTGVEEFYIDIILG